MGVFAQLPARTAASCSMVYEWEGNYPEDSKGDQISV